MYLYVAGEVGVGGSSSVVDKAWICNLEDGRVCEGYLGRFCVDRNQRLSQKV